MMKIREGALIGKGNSNLIGALGEIIAWDALRKTGIWAFKIGSWNFFPEGYPNFRDRKMMFLTREQTEFIEHKEKNQIIEFDLVAFKPKNYFSSLIMCREEVEAVYLIEVKAGRGSNIRFYLNNPERAFSPKNLENAKKVEFKVALVVVELLENWKFRMNYLEIG